jgi:hypothetical protein
MRFLLLGALLFSAAACTEARESECKDVCEREAGCADSIENYKFDQDECISACSALMRDEEGKAYVHKHKECVDKADSCQDLYRKCTFAYEQANDKPSP